MKPYLHEDFKFAVPCRVREGGIGVLLRNYISDTDSPCVPAYNVGFNFGKISMFNLSLDGNALIDERHACGASHKQSRALENRLNIH